MTSSKTFVWSSDELLLVGDFDVVVATTRTEDILFLDLQPVRFAGLLWLKVLFADLL
jgi:hypothetical protein